MSKDNRELILEGISNIKRNKKLIQACISLVDKYFDTCNNSAELSNHTEIEVKIDKDITFMNVPVNAILNANAKTIAVEDSKGKVYIGISTDTRDIYLDNDISNLSSIDSRVGLDIWRAVKGMGQQSILDRINYEEDATLIYDITNHGFWDGAAEAVRKTKLYKEAIDAIVKKLNNSKVYLQLWDNHFKYITSNRKFIPVLIIDFDKSVIYWYTWHDPDTERKNRDSVYIDTFVNDMDNLKHRMKYMRIPMGFMKVNLE